MVKWSPSFGHVMKRQPTHYLRIQAKSLSLKSPEDLGKLQFLFEPQCHLLCNESLDQGIPESTNTHN